MWWASPRSSAFCLLSSSGSCPSKTFWGAGDSQESMGQGSHTRTPGPQAGVPSTVLISKDGLPRPPLAQVKHQP